MLLERIEENLKKIENNLDKDNFIYQFLEAYEQPKSSIKRLKDGDYNLSKKTNEVIWKKKIHFYVTSETEDIHDTIDNLSKEDFLEKNKTRFLIVTDFKDLLSVDIKNKKTLDIKILELSKNLTFFLPLTGLEQYEETEESQVDIKAAYKMGKLYDIIIENNKNISVNSRERHGLNIFFTRILFCFFAEDSDIFERGIFTKSIGSHTNHDGSDLEKYLENLFEILNLEKRTNVPEHLKLFPYVNGGLFKNKYKIPKLTSEFRKILLECGDLDWGFINPDIFGSMMQAVVQRGERKELGMHYTSSSNILKSIKPLFLDDLYEEFAFARKDKKKLNKILLKIYNTMIFDPACGSGNFLVVAYKELYKLEIEILKDLREIDPNDWLIFKSGIKLSNFYGIEKDDYAHEMAKLSLWIAEHQMNIFYSEVLNKERPTLPLSVSGNIFCGNALEINWNDICKIEKEKKIYLIGNPPYLGAKLQTKEQKKDLSNVFKGLKSFKNLDYIACWFYLASKFIKNIDASFSFVSTNSITQGEQVNLIWPEIFKLNLEIFFAYKTFKWKNNAKSNAGVSCVIIGIQNKKNNIKKIFKENSNQYLKVKYISPYLLEIDPSILVKRENQHICNLPEMLMGNMPRDGGNFILDESSYREVSNDTNIKKFIKKLKGSSELIQGHKRWCLWIEDKDVDEAQKIDFIKERLIKVKNFRSSSEAKSTRDMANTSHKFAQIQHKPAKAIIIPKTSSSRRDYLPIDFVDIDTVIGDSCFGIYNPELYLFGLLSSKMHTIWLNTIAGKLRMDYRYSSTLCYNSFVPPILDSTNIKEIEELVLDILDEREFHSQKTLAELYDPDKMSNSLKKIHNNLDSVIEKFYRKDKFIDDDDRLKFLFKLYAQNKKKDMLI